MGELHYRNYDEQSLSEAPVKQKQVGVCVLTQQLTNNLLEILAMCERANIIINGPRPEDNSKREGPNSIREHLALNICYTEDIHEKLCRILEALDG